MSDRGLLEILFQGGRNYNRPSTDYRSQRYRLSQPSDPLYLARPRSFPNDSTVHAQDCDDSMSVCLPLGSFEPMTNYRVI